LLSVAAIILSEVAVMLNVADVILNVPKDLMSISKGFFGLRPQNDGVGFFRLRFLRMADK
jgi:hypothetical protein